ncbi:MAG: hypothetical protein IJ520_10395, partial [Synergistaceae bacterium]|nr:hypothetical protein [Synergistaceae bacterium]
MEYDPTEGTLVVDDNANARVTIRGITSIVGTDDNETDITTLTAGATTADAGVKVTAPTAPDTAYKIAVDGTGNAAGHDILEFIITFTADTDKYTHAGFWKAAADNYDTFALMLPDIAKWVAANPTATPAKLAKKIAEDLYAPSYAAANYVETIASKDKLEEGADFVLNWAVSKDANYPTATPAPVKAYLLKDESVTIKPELAAASVVDSKNKATSIKPDTRIFRVEVASFDKGKPV